MIVIKRKVTIISVSSCKREMVSLTYTYIMNCCLYLTPVTSLPRFEVGPVGVISFLKRLKKCPVKRSRRTPDLFQVPFVTVNVNNNGSINK